MVIRLKKRYFAFLAAVVLAAVSMIAAASRKELLQTAELPAIMYHHFTDDSSQSGQYVVTAAQFEDDMKYLSENGYTAVTVSQLEQFAQNGKALPEKPVLITCDDGYESFYVYAFPVLKKYKMNCILSVIGTYSEMYSENGNHNVRYSNCTWEQIKEMSQSGVVEIGNHTWDLHSLKDRTGCTKRRDECCEEYVKMLGEDIGKLQSRLKETVGITPKVFAYPYGKHCAEARKTVDSLGFTVTLGVEEKINHLTAGDPDCLKMMRRFNRDGRLSMQVFFDKIKQ